MIKEKYGEEVVKILNNKREKVILVLSRNHTNDFLERYSDFFKEKIIDGNYGIELNSRITTNDLIEKFRGYLDLDLLLSFVDEKAIKTLGV